MDVLILGGTGEARELAAALQDDGVATVTSLAGRVAAPAALAGAVRTGGFGGEAGLRAYLERERPHALIDATHPFAAQMSAHAVAAAAATGTPLLRLERPGWTQRPGDRWHRFPSLQAAAEQVARGPAADGLRVLLTLGAHGVSAFARVETAHFLVRAIDEPEGPLPRHHELLRARGPFTESAERELLRQHRIDLLVSRDSGGPQTAAKLAAARALGVPVLLVDRPATPPAPEAVATPAQARGWVRRLRSSRCPPPHDSSPGAAGSRPASESPSPS